MNHLDIAYENLNDLLDECFWAERRYFNAAEEVEITEYKRFLAKESVSRNKFCHKIVSRMAEEGITPNRLDIVKGSADRDWLDVIAAMEHKTPTNIVGACMIQDEMVLILLKRLIDDSWLPVHILEVLVPMEFQIKQSHADLAKLKAKVKKKYKDSQL
ncbi:DUF2383 domain-containing protein [Dokdonia donghaensis]|uniref:DUF2383 domain-containing protein n=1 Tax=Dokdonia donghaensis DSW-1 TaxID=1300343 RepID=A0A0A2GZA8_9FLAO|nr:DUF2383 domain-containing protein [Dokdonia donghaensis]ANH60407.1 hypothetical protein I597_1496 [Dokdonia donghaensis DSW-1]KGO07676.1 hypothetical protein NV36_13075 [Dokdonia donghaensis DSW-1]